LGNTIQGALAEYLVVDQHALVEAPGYLYPFADALAAYDHLYRGAFGKIVIRVTD
jgi:NADPH:quinone reductase-like Zn-dependent oxidoreductase